jgi:thiosulfate reductase cytochrome b subunit
VQLISGFAYYYHDEIVAAGVGLPLEPVAIVHTAGAFCLVAFLIAHVYLTTTGHTVSANLKAMITGYEKAHEAGLETAPRPAAVRRTGKA